MIVRTGSLQDNRTICVTLGGSSIGEIYFINIYVVNCSKERATMWANLTESFEHGKMYILGRDWNMTEQDSDKSSGCSRKLS